ncbi:hypothetical protein [Vampirovibrio sp.]|uniref:hypothetical protein n=1 Tax=Vampirovibrio sp. TaxID=2717857 RepID=UPI003593558B
MPPDIQGCVYKFVPNNPALSSVVIKVLKRAFQTHSLPMPLVKQVVERALEQSRTMDMKVESSSFEEKLFAYANQVRPRFIAQLNDLRRQGKKW